MEGPRELEQPRWSLEESGFGLFFQTVTLSFQRYRRPARAIVGLLPTSLGALPLWDTGAGHYLLPVDDVEAVWIGITRPSSAPQLSLEALSVTGARISLQTLSKAVEPHEFILGWPINSLEYHVISRVGPSSANCVDKIDVTVLVEERGSQGQIVTTVRLVSFDEFTRNSSLPALRKLDSDVGYKGMLLP